MTISRRSMLAGASLAAAAAATPVGAQNRTDPDLVRAVNGFDAILVLSGSTASTGLPIFA